MEIARQTQLKKLISNNEGSAIKDPKKSTTPSTQSVTKPKMESYIPAVISNAETPKENLYKLSPSSESSEDVRPLKKRKVFNTRIEPVYPFFGSKLPEAPKLLALRCLEFLDGKDIYAISLVNRLWSKASMDDALWENNE